MLNKIELRFNNIDARFNSIDKRFVRLESTFQEIKVDLQKILHLLEQQSRRTTLALNKIRNRPNRNQLQVKMMNHKTRHDALS